MLISTVSCVKPLKPGFLPGISGPALHGMFFSWLRGIDPVLTVKLHEPKSARPFTISNLYEGDGTGAASLFRPTKNIELDPDKRYWFRFTSLDKELSTLLAERFFQHPPLSLEISQNYFKVEKVIVSQAEHPWAGTTTWQELTQTNFLSENALAMQANRSKLIFFSPTTFKAMERSFPVPLPAQTFISLANRWNNFSPVPINPAFGAFLDESIGINAYNLESELVTLGGSKQGGKMVCFRGWCEYISFEAQSEWNRVIKMLTQFAFFSGVGYKTTMGLGQVVSTI